MVDTPEALFEKGMLQGGSTFVHALGRGGQLLLGPAGYVVGLGVSVAPNAVEHIINGDPAREFWTDVIVDGTGYAISTLTGGLTGIGVFAAATSVGQPEIGLPAAILTDIGVSAGVSVAWDLYVAPEYVRPWVYQRLPGWVH